MKVQSTEEADEMYQRGFRCGERLCGSLPPDFLEKYLADKPHLQHAFFQGLRQSAESGQEGVSHAA